MTTTHAARRYRRSLLLLMAGYGLALFGVSAYFANAPRSGVLTYVAALIPALPVIGIFVIIARFLTELDDEYLRMLEVRKALVATGFALSLATAWGFLEAFGRVPHLDSYWVAIAWFGGLGLGGCVNALWPPGGRTVEP